MLWSMVIRCLQTTTINQRTRFLTSKFKAEFKRKKFSNFKATLKLPNTILKRTLYDPLESLNPIGPTNNNKYKKLVMIRKFVPKEGQQIAFKNISCLTLSLG